MDEDLSRNLKSESKWLRFVYMLLFAVTYQVVELLVFVIVIVQFVIDLFTGEPNAKLLAFSRELNRYVLEILSFLTFTSEEKPFPFSDWPQTSAAKSLHP